MCLQVIVFLLDSSPARPTLGPPCDPVQPLDHHQSAVGTGAAGYRSRRIRLNAVSMPSLEDSSSSASSSCDDGSSVYENPDPDPEVDPDRIRRTARQMGEYRPAVIAGERRERIRRSGNWLEQDQDEHEGEEAIHGEVGADGQGSTPTRMSPEWRLARPRSLGRVPLPPMIPMSLGQVPLPPMIPHSQFSTPVPPSRRSPLLQSTSLLPPRSSFPASRSRAEAGGLMTAWQADRDSTLEDDILELSSRMVRGFIVKAAKFTLLLAFKLWLTTARWGPMCYLGTPYVRTV